MWGKRMEILRKIISAITPASKKDIEFISKILDGMTIASDQQAEMLASLANQVSKSQQGETQKKEEINDPSFG